MQVISDRCDPALRFVAFSFHTAGQTLSAMDLLIAVHVLGLDASLVTNNLAHFRRVPGLKIADWR